MAVNPPQVNALWQDPFLCAGRHAHVMVTFHDSCAHAEHLIQAVSIEGFPLKADIAIQISSRPP